MLHTSRKLSFLLLLSAALALAACGGNASATEGAPASEPATQAPASVSTTGKATAVPTAEAATTAPAGGTDGVSFSKDIQPILESRCLNCHGGERTSAGLSLKTYNTLMAGSENGSVITSGDAANSQLVKLVTAGKMPKRGPKLTPAEIQLLTDWVNAGATNN